MGKGVKAKMMPEALLPAASPEHQNWKISRFKAD